MKRWDRVKVHRSRQGAVTGVCRRQRRRTWSVWGEVKGTAACWAAERWLPHTRSHGNAPQTQTHRCSTLICARQRRLRHGTDACAVCDPESGEMGQQRSGKTNLVKLPVLQPSQILLHRPTAAAASSPLFPVITVHKSRPTDRYTTQTPACPPHTSQFTTLTTASSRVCVLCHPCRRPQRWRARGESGFPFTAVF